MRTIGRRAPSNWTGAYASMCDRCGTYWPRNELTLHPDGLLSCPDEGSLPETLELARAKSKKKSMPLPVVVQPTDAAWFNDLPDNYLVDEDTAMVTLDDDGEVIETE